ncbi:MAG: hypothetical protein Q7R40_02900 [Phaeospirillum sp.]|nr:hypothetical protein [Phaeospirillum sp.]
MDFSSNLAMVYGASNTGKSFAVKAIDFMLGGSTALPDIGERNGYDRIWVGMSAGDDGDITLTRAIAGGSFEVAGGLITSHSGRQNMRPLSARHDPDRPDNVSHYLLQCVGLSGQQIAVDANGKKRYMSFRDLARYCVTDETSIQSEQSPAQSGQHLSATRERSVLKLLLTGVDDDAVVEILDRKTFSTSKTAKIEVFDEMLANIDAEIEGDYPDIGELPDQERRLEETFIAAQAEVETAQHSVHRLFASKRSAANSIENQETRLSEIDVNLSRFSQLDEIYSSDIDRLEALEEAGFLIGLGGAKDCPLCGAQPESQHHNHTIDEVSRVREAAEREIGKINVQRVDLTRTVEDLCVERVRIAEQLPGKRERLEQIEAEINRIAPVALEARRQLDELMVARDRVKHGLTLIESRQALVKKRDELAALKPARRQEKPQLGVSGVVAHEFAQTVSRVLTEWHFPGNRHVAWDDDAYDLRIDGKRRRDNGKGVRAITHAAFKVALLIFAREHDLAHPGFVILDTPLLTYRDPMASREGELTADERQVAESSLKEHFFRHLAATSSMGQFIIVENVDPPANILEIGNVETFFGGRKGARYGLFPHR